MSGGSYDYAYSQMESGEIDKFARYASSFVAHLERLSERLGRGEVQTYGDGGWRSLTDEQRMVGTLAVDAAVGAFVAARKHLVAMETRMRDLAELAHAIEWKDSGDRGDDQTVETCVEWMRKKLAP